jgi:hypothetical protein
VPRVIPHPTPTTHQHINTPTGQHTNTPVDQHQQRTKTTTDQNANTPADHTNANTPTQQQVTPTSNTNRPQPSQGANQGWRDYQKNGREERGIPTAAPNAHSRVVAPKSCCESRQGAVVSVDQAAPAVSKGYPPRRTSYRDHTRSRAASSVVDYRLRDQGADIVQVKEST